MKDSFSRVTKEYLSEFYRILDCMINNMTEARLGDSIGYNFIAQMIPHHMAAIEMSKNILKYTTFVPVQNIALRVISEQTESIENMRSVSEACSCLENTERDVRLYQRGTEQIMSRMFADMSSACATNRINNDFMREMIPHHEGAVEMSKNALRFDICEGLEPVLEAIITSQERGIKQMRCLLKCCGCM